MKHILSVLAFIAMLLAAMSPARSDDRPLIWEPTMPNDTSFGARLGSRLPTPWTSTAGVTISVDGSDSMFGVKPVIAWTTVELPVHARKGNEKTARLHVQARGADGMQTATLTRSVKAKLPRIDTQLDQTLALDRNPSSDEHVHLRTTQSVRVTSPRTRTSLVATASRNGTNPWKTAIVVEQPVRKALKLTARVEGENFEHGKARLGASYSFKW